MWLKRDEGRVLLAEKIVGAGGADTFEIMVSIYKDIFIALFEEQGSGLLENQTGEWVEVKTVFQLMGGN